MKRVLISGYYGYNNIGDEAVLGGLLAGMRAELPNVEPVVLSGDPQTTIRLHDVAAIPRMNREAIQAELKRADLLISGGGSLLQDVTSYRSPLYYLGILWLAQRAGVPTMMCAQGVGPLNHALNRCLTKHILNKVKSITVRDQGSADLLQKIGVDKPPIEVTADPSFLLEPKSSPQLGEWWSVNIPADRPVIGIALRGWGDIGEGFAEIGDALKELAERSNAVLLYLPMQFNQDIDVAKEVARFVPLESRVCSLQLTPPEMLDVIGRCDFILAMRLHALIFAVHRGVPALGIAYDPKVHDFALSAGLPVPTPWEEIDRKFTNTLLKHWEAREAIKQTLKDTTPRLTTLAHRNIERVKELL